ncbi:hypothetical protein GCM10009037_09240 [Halarchaeum grantii]|uniref:Histidine kinase domain-containing protein n=1 Tax=Halarchaeum grantii TaxID=1193105 RepID=A0A830ETC9_9EURY|nr:ATP-binding protein [Halarchaeum grantii]GGL27812.1 hypothetical protein GCM10009037_09240 [Halarchaeum grantii]
MDDVAGVRSRWAWVIIAVVSGALVAYNISHFLLGHADTHALPVDYVVGWAPSLALSVAVVASMRWARGRDADDYGWTFCRWFLSGALVLGASGAASLAVEALRGATLAEPVFVTGMWVMGGGVVGLYVGYVDTRRQMAREHAERASADAQRLAQQLSVINRVLRHDVRTDLNVVLGYADQVGGYFEAGEEPPELKKLRERAHRLVDLAEQARVVEGLLEDDRVRPIAVGEQLTSRLTELRLDHPDIDVSGTVDEDAVARGHRLLELALDAVLDTAVADTADVTTLDVTCRLVDDGETVEIVVVDDGPGIPAGARVISRDEAETPLEHADGIGLWTVRWAVERSEGTFDLGDGSEDRIRIRLPAHGDFRGESD